MVPERREAARESFGIGDELTVALVGALSEEKRPELAVAAVALIDGVHLLVAGDGPLRTEIATRGITDAPGRVHVLGALADPSPVYDAADVLVLPSRTEGLPGVLIEAGLRGLPCVATDVGYVSDIVVDGETGVLVPSGDPAALGRRAAPCDGLGPRVRGGRAGALPATVRIGPDRRRLGTGARASCEGLGPTITLHRRRDCRDREQPRFAHYRDRRSIRRHSCSVRGSDSGRARGGVARQRCRAHSRARRHRAAGVELLRRRVHPGRHLQLTSRTSSDPVRDRAEEHDPDGAGPPARGRTPRLQAPPEYIWPSTT